MYIATVYTCMCTLLLWSLIPLTWKIVWLILQEIEKEITKELSSSEDIDGEVKLSVKGKYVVISSKHTANV